ncbi:hypothetical protein ABZ464_41085 [Streptomyces sp. NPDC005820]
MPDNSVHDGDLTIVRTRARKRVTISPTGPARVSARPRVRA